MARGIWSTPGRSASRAMATRAPATRWSIRNAATSRSIGWTIPSRKRSSGFSKKDCQRFWHKGSGLGGETSMKLPVSITINDREYQREVEPRLLLVHFLREVAGLTGTKIGCDTSQCGACTVLLD